MFVVSGKIPVDADTNYRITSQMRYSFASDLDSALLSVIQFDGSGNVVGFDEVAGRKGENFWTWQPKGLIVRTLPSAAAIQIRLGLIAASESYLDVDDVR